MHVRHAALILILSLLAAPGYRQSLSGESSSEAPHVRQLAALPLLFELTPDGERRAAAASRQRSIGTASHGFVMRLTTGGESRFSIYFGGLGEDYPGGIALGPDGTLYVAGSTSSDSFPGTRADVRTVALPDWTCSSSVRRTTACA